MNNKILFVNQNYHIGGGQTYVNNLVEYASTHKKDNVILLEDASIQKILRALFDPSVKTVVWSDYAGLSFFVYIISYLLGKKNIVIIYGIWLYEYRSLNRRYNSLKRTLKHYIHQLRIWLRQLLICAVSQRIAHLSVYSKNLFFSNTFYRVLSAKKHVVIYGGVDSNYFSPLSESQRRILRSSLGLRASDVILLMAGRIEPRKNYIDGIRILKKLREAQPNKQIFLYFVFSHGDCNDSVYLDVLFKEIKQQKMGSYIRIISGLTNQEIAPFYQISDVFLMLSKELETFGLVTLEALSCGCPVFGYDMCATPEIVHDSSHTRLFPPNNLRGIVESIAMYIHHMSKERRAVMAKSRKTAVKFSWDKVGQRLFEDKSYDII